VPLLQLLRPGGELLAGRRHCARARVPRLACRLLHPLLRLALRLLPCGGRRLLAAKHLRQLLLQEGLHVGGCCCSCSGRRKLLLLGLRRPWRCPAKHLVQLLLQEQLRVWCCSCTPRRLLRLCSWSGRARRSCCGLLPRQHPGQRGCQVEGRGAGRRACSTAWSWHGSRRCRRCGWAVLQRR
jgi:hypothetical protein